MQSRYSFSVGISSAELAAPSPPAGPGADGLPSPGACIVLTLPSEESGRLAPAMAAAGLCKTAESGRARTQIGNTAATRAIPRVQRPLLNFQNGARRTGTPNVRYIRAINDNTFFSPRCVHASATDEISLALSRARERAPLRHCASLSTTPHALHAASSFQ